MTIEFRGADPEAQLVQRALAAYYRTRSHDQVLVDQPTDTQLTEVAGRRYVVLRGSERILAVYRVLYKLTNQSTVWDRDRQAMVTDGNLTPVLKRMKRWPRELEAVQA